MSTMTCVTLPLFSILQDITKLFEVCWRVLTHDAAPNWGVAMEVIGGKEMNTQIDF